MLRDDSLAFGYMLACLFYLTAAVISPSWFIAGMGAALWYASFTFALSHRCATDERALPE